MLPNTYVSAFVDTGTALLLYICVLYQSRFYRQTHVRS